MSTHALHADADTIPVIHVHTAFQHMMASLGVVSATASAYLAGTGLILGREAVLVAMASQWWWMPLMTAATWGMTTVVDKARVFAKQRQTINDLHGEIGHLRKDVINLSASIEVLLGQIADDKDTQIRLRSDLSDAYARLSQYEPRTPNPDV